MAVNSKVIKSGKSRVVEGRSIKSKPVSSTMSDKKVNAKVINASKLDQKTKDTILHSIIGFLIVYILNFALSFGLYGELHLGIIGFIVGLFWTVLWGGLIGFIIAKLYDQIMKFVGRSLGGLGQYLNTFFKLLFIPATVLSGFYSLGVFLFALLGTGLAIGLGTALGGAGVGVLGGLLGGSLLLLILWGFATTVLGRFVYAKYMDVMVGKYYKNYSLEVAKVKKKKTILR
jgi:hypothetical protein